MRLPAHTAHHRPVHRRCASYSDVITPAPKTVPEAEWQLVASEVVARIRVHPLLQELRDAGHPVLISCHERAIWAHTIHRGGGDYGIEARIETPSWWEGRRLTRDDWVIRLSNTLAKEVRRQWADRSDRSSAGRSATLNPGSQ